MLTSFPHLLMAAQFDTPEIADFGPLVAPALVKLESAYQAAERARAAIELDNTMTADGQAAAIEKVYADHVEPARINAWKTLLKIGPILASMEQEADAALAPSNMPSAIALTAEIRQAFKSMAPDEREAVIVAAIESGDKTTLSAAIHGPAWLTGLSPDLTQSIRDQYLAKHDPAKLANLNQMRRMDEQSRRAAVTSVNLRASFFDPRLEGIVSRAAEMKARTADAMRGFDPPVE